MTRIYQEVPFGFACYEGVVVKGVFTGRHVGVAQTKKKAKSFVKNGSKRGLLLVWDRIKPIGEHGTN